MTMQLNMLGVAVARYGAYCSPTPPQVMRHGRIIKVLDIRCRGIMNVEGKKKPLEALKEWNVGH